jgi:hypothetical protein
MVRSKVGSKSHQGARDDDRVAVERRAISGVYAIPLAVAASYDVAVARDEYIGLDRLDREELDEADADSAPVVTEVRVIVPARYRQSA